MEYTDYYAISNDRFIFILSGADVLYQHQYYRHHRQFDVVNRIWIGLSKNLNIVMTVRWVYILYFFDSRNRRKSFATFYVGNAIAACVCAGAHMLQH